MASISKQPNGHKTIQFIGGDRIRRSIRLGKVSMKHAESFKSKVENLVASKLTGHALDDVTSLWLHSLEPAMLERLSRVGLISQSGSKTLRSYLDNYIEKRTDVKPRTTTKYRTTANYLCEYFGDETILNSITPGDADEWRISLNEKGLAENTIRKYCGIAKVFFYAAKRKKILSENPFEDLKAAVKPNRQRDYFVTVQEAEKVLSTCPDAEWRLIFSLARYGGLRTPSEIYALRWDEVNWSEGRFYVRSPKTEHHEGREGRIVPLFPQLRPHLEQCFELAEDRETHVISKHRIHSENLRTRFRKIVVNAGLNPWPKLFQNLRATRETELLQEGYPLQTVLAWIGNSAVVALKSYLQVREEDFQRALHNPVQQQAKSSENKRNLDHKQ